MFIESANLNLEIRGDDNAARTLLLVHGAGGGAALWDEFMNLPATDLRVAALDLSGHGGSPDKENFKSPDTYVADVQAAIRALGGEPPALGGHSMGGAVAMLTALRHPETIRALILIGTGARLRVLPSIIGQLEKNFSGAVASMCGFAFSDKTQAEQARRMSEAMLKAGAEVTLRDFTLCDNFDIMPDAGKIAHPTLVVCGEKDMMTPPKYSKWLSENIPGAKLALIPGRGHMLMMEAPGELAAALSEFLEKIY